MREQGRGNEQQIEHRQPHQHAFPGGVSPKSQRADDERHADCHRQPGRQAEIEAAGLDRDELGDQRQQVAEHEVAHREIAPERAESLEDEFGMAAMRRHAEPHRHFLHHERHQEGEQDERNEEADPIGRAGGGVGDHAGAVVLAHHDQHARTGQQPEQPQRTLGGAGLEHLQTIARAQDVLVGDELLRARRRALESPKFIVLSLTGPSEVGCRNLPPLAKLRRSL